MSSFTRAYSNIKSKSSFYVGVICFFFFILYYIVPYRLTITLNILLILSLCSKSFFPTFFWQIIDFYNLLELCQSLRVHHTCFLWFDSTLDFSFGAIHLRVFNHNFVIAYSSSNEQTNNHAESITISKNCFFFWKNYAIDINILLRLLFRKCLKPFSDISANISVSRTEWLQMNLLNHSRCNYIHAHTYCSFVNETYEHAKELLPSLIPIETN